MLTQNQVGPVATTASIAPGTLTPGRAGNLGDLIVSELHGRYYEQTYRRNVFVAANLRVLPRPRLHLVLQSLLWVYIFLIRLVRL